MWNPELFSRHLLELKHLCPRETRELYSLDFPLLERLDEILFNTSPTAFSYAKPPADPPAARTAALALLRYELEHHLELIVLHYRLNEGLYISQESMLMAYPGLGDFLAPDIHAFWSGLKADRHPLFAEKTPDNQHFIRFLIAAKNDPRHCDKQVARHIYRQDRVPEAEIERLLAAEFDCQAA